MFEEAYGRQGPLTEADLRAEIAALERRRVSLIEAKVAFYQGPRYHAILVALGRAWVSWALVAILAADVLITVMTRSLLVAVVGLGLMVAVTGYERYNIDAWVAEHNARIDDRIRALLAEAAADEGS
jgi:hypothetical protein